MFSVKDIFSQMFAGMKSERDSIALHYNKNELDKVITDLRVLILSSLEINMPYEVTQGIDRYCEQSRIYQKINECILMLCISHLYIEKLFYMNF